MFHLTKLYFSPPSRTIANDNNYLRLVVDNGNLLSGDGAKTYKYDAENRLVEVDYVGGSNKSVFSYDGLNRRTVVAETVSGVTTTKRYLWCGDRVCQVRDAADTVLKRILPEGEFTVTGATKLVYMQDQLGSVRDVIDATTGTRVKSYDYTAYGKVARNNGTGDTDYRYAGLWYHPQSTLNLAKYRAQDGATGRWINRDPIREAGGINLYGYVGANPLNKLDPVGFEGQQCADEKDCEKQTQADEAVCRSLQDPAARSRCWQSANERFGACSANKPLPPLITWKDEPDNSPIIPQMPSTPNSLPWWMPIPLIPFPGNPVYGGL